MENTEGLTLRDQLAEHTALLKTAGRVARLGGWTIELPERTLTWSDETCAIHDVAPGYTPTFEEGIGLYLPEHRAAVIKSVDDCIRDGTPYDFELPKLTSTGRLIWVRSIGEAVRDDEGRIVRLHGAFQDISERHQVEEALRGSEALFRTLAEAMPQMVWMTRPDGCNTYVNQRWVDYTGLGLEDSSGLGWSIPFHPDDHAPARGWQQAIEGGDYNVECRLRRSDGAYRWMLVRGLPYRDTTGAITQWIGTCTDVDDLKQAQQAAQRAEAAQRELAVQLELEAARLVAAQAVARIGSWETDLGTGRVIWSAETFRIFDTTPAQFVPTHQGFLSFIHPDDRAMVDEAFVQAQSRTTPAACEHRLLLRDGRIAFVEERWQIVRDAAGLPLRAVGTCQDVTARKDLERQHWRAQRLESIGTLAGGIAHDLNNVLAPILLSIGLLREGERDPERLCTLATIEAGARRGASMIRRVLSFANGVEGQSSEVRLGPLVRELATIVKATFPKNIRFEEDVDPGIWPLHADPTQIHQVLINLCVNARDAMPAGGPIRLTAANVVIDEEFVAANIDAHLGRYVAIELADRGSGIPRAIIDKIFDPFFTTKDIGQGTGLGLATSLAIVKGHGGFMRVDSEPGLGTRLRVYLPAPASVPPRAPVTAVADCVDRPRGAGELVMVVDDEAFIRDIARRTLESFGYRVLVAADGVEALALYQQHRAEIAAVVTDMTMPVMGGAELIAELARHAPLLRIIRASGQADDATTPSGPLSFLAKPYSAEMLLAAVRAAVTPAAARTAPPTT